jgi:hypothetical protein
VLFYFPSVVLLKEDLPFTLSCSMTRKERYAFVIDYFQQHMPVAETELEFEDPMNYWLPPFFLPNVRTRE